MLQAIETGKLAISLSEDNPCVGCVIVRNNSVLGKGLTNPPGGPHAEVSAWLDAKNKNLDVEGATLYTTVEPRFFFTAGLLHVLNKLSHGGLVE